MATSSFRLLIQGSSTNLHVWLLWYHDVGTQFSVGAPNFLKHRFSLRSRGDCLVWTTPQHVPTFSGLSIVIPLPLLPTPPSLHVGTLSRYLGVVPLLLQWL